MKNFVLAIAVSLLLTCSAFGWNCTTPGQVRVQVPTGTVGAGTGDGSGQVVVDDGLTFICEALPTGSATSTTNTNNNTNSNANTNSNTLSSVVNNAVSQGQKQAQKQQQNQSQTATGGNATSSATGGNANATAQDNGNGNGNGSNNTTTNVAASKIPVASAMASTLLPSAPCTKNYGASAQTMPFGASIGGGKIDEGCDIRETARSFSGISKLAQCKLLINEKQSKKAGVTLVDCMGVPEVPPAPIVVAPTPQTLVIPAPIVSVPTVVSRVEAFQGYFTRVDNVAKAQLDGTILLLRNHPDAWVRLRFNPGSASGATETFDYLTSNGIDQGRIELRTDGHETGVEVLFLNQ